METVKGFKDFVGEEAQKRADIAKVLGEIFELYGFEPAETPLIEYKEFVKGDNESDEAVSDIFKLKDRGARDLALRYEFTFQLKRLMKNKKLPFKRYQIGPVFRDEPVKGNRFRQFTQCDVDIVGSTIKDEAEVLAVVKRVLEKLGIEFIIYINNRKLLNEILEKENIEAIDREKVIREIDKLDKLDEDEVFNNLRGYGAQNLLEIFKKPGSYFEKYESYNEIKELKEFCKIYGVEVKFLPSLARGLSYYNGSIFEIKTKKMKESITAGGSFMFNDVQSTGLSFGLDRLTMQSNLVVERDNVMIISIEQDLESIKISETLRDEGISCFLFSGKISKALDYANSKNIGKVVFVGERELAEKKVKFKNMASGKEKLIAIKDLAKEVKK